MKTNLIPTNFTPTADGFKVGGYEGGGYIKVVGVHYGHQLGFIIKYDA